MEKSSLASVSASERMVQNDRVTPSKRKPQKQFSDESVLLLVNRLNVSTVFDVNARSWDHRSSTALT